MTKTIRLQHRWIKITTIGYKKTHVAIGWKGEYKAHEERILPLSFQDTFQLFLKHYQNEGE